MEDPGYPIGRHALELCGMRIVPVPVDNEGLDVGHGIAMAPEAAVALVTPGQQVPLGVTLSKARGAALLDWAKSADTWIIEDDFLGDLQLDGRAAPALASMDALGRVIHIGTFSKTMMPALGLGFLVAPPQLSGRFADIATYLAPALNTNMQRALAEFLWAGHYMRHLRRMKTLYAARREHLYSCLAHYACMAVDAPRPSGLMVRLLLLPGVDDVDLASRALEMGLAPIPLSTWYVEDKTASRGLLLGVPNLVGAEIETWCETLADLVSASLA